MSTTEVMTETTVDFQNQQMCIHVNNKIVLNQWQKMILLGRIDRQRDWIRIAYPK